MVSRLLPISDFRRDLVLENLVTEKKVSVSVLENLERKNPNSKKETKTKARALDYWFLSNCLMLTMIFISELDKFNY